MERSIFRGSGSRIRMVFQPIPQSQGLISITLFTSSKITRSPGMHQRLHLQTSSNHNRLHGTLNDLVSNHHSNLLLFHSFTFAIWIALTMTLRYTWCLRSLPTFPNTMNRSKNEDLIMLLILKCYENLVGFLNIFFISSYEIWNARRWVLLPSSWNWVFYEIVDYSCVEFILTMFSKINREKN